MGDHTPRALRSILAYAGRCPIFRFAITRLPWRGASVAAQVERAGAEGARLAAEYIAERARFYCPVDSGDLRRSIKVIPTRGGTRWSVVATMKYAIHVEFGTTHHGPNGSYFIAPQPFMRKAFADGRKQFPTILRDAYVKAKRGDLTVGGSFTAAA